jgi:hypothetical protein
LRLANMGRQALQGTRDLVVFKAFRTPDSQEPLTLPR